MIEKEMLKIRDVLDRLSSIPDERDSSWQPDVAKFFQQHTTADNHQWIDLKHAMAEFDFHQAPTHDDLALKGAFEQEMRLAEAYYHQQYVNKL